ncbi:MAG: signal peptidase I [Anaerovoracaceae bacterium]
MEAIICAVVLIGSKLILGFILGQLGGSPYDLSPKGMGGNLFFVLPALGVRESIRSYILSIYCSKHNLKVFILVTLLLTALSLNYSGLSPMDTENIVIFIAREAGPKLSINIALSYLALHGGIIAASVYIWIIEVFHWISPVLPSLNWLAEGAIGILVPVVSILIILNKHEERKHRFDIEKKHTKSMATGIATSILAIGLLWFIVGVFPVMPSVIVTGSMEPIMYPGDVILLRQMRTEEQLGNLKEGDVIQFQRGEIRITHRIVKIIDDGKGNLTYKTKGDNNSSEDGRVVHPNEIKGTLVRVVPKIGYPTLIIKGSNHAYIREIEF